MSESKPDEGRLLNRDSFEGLTFGDKVWGMIEPMLQSQDAKTASIMRVEFNKNYKDWEEATIKAEKLIIEGKDAEIAKLKNEVTALHRERQGEVWYWQGDGEDKIESLTCPILIEPEDFKAECQERVERIFKEIERHSWNTPYISFNEQLAHKEPTVYREIKIEEARWQALKKKELK